MKIGILGGGQLARMLIEGSYKYGFEFTVLSKEKNSPAGQIIRNEIVGDWNDENCLKEFSSKCDIITLENEFIDFQKIKFIEDTGKTVYPRSNIIRLIQDKLYQKETLQKIKIPVADFSPVETKEDIKNFALKNSFPVVLKSRTMGYDGKGNYLINSEKDIDTAFDALSKRGKLMCESFVKFEKEIAIQVARNKLGEVRIYPVVETVQENHICNLVMASANSFLDIRKEVEMIAGTIVNHLSYVGVMGIEMFFSGDKILVNELAPRVHNSGHYTIEGCYTSQFENHVRAILNFPLGNTEFRDKNCVMINILGKRSGEAKLTSVEKILSKENIYLHIYGKTQTKPGRKMGHITVIHDNLDSAVEIAKSARAEIGI